MNLIFLGLPDFVSTREGGRNPPTVANHYAAKIVVSRLKALEILNMAVMNVQKPTGQRGFALVDAIAVIGVAGILAGAIATTKPGPLASARQSARQLKDSTQLRAILQSCVIWATNNKDLYPLPSVLDVQNLTVKDVGKAKDHTANIFSILIWNGSIAPELTISPLENNKRIAVFEKYQFSMPTAAVEPKVALWDPAFSADFTGKDSKGNVSYAHLQPSGGRLARWINSFNAEEAILSSRGPEITAVKVHNEISATPTYANADSNTFKFFTPSGTWSGNVAFNDSHVDFIKDHFKPGAKVETDAFYTVKDKDTGKDKKLPDMSFFDEPDDAASVNNFLGIFTKAGAKPADFKSIWD